MTSTRRHLGRYASALALACAVACRGAGDDPSALYAEAAAALQRGALQDAAALVTRGTNAARDDEAARARFRLLDAEVRLMQRDLAGAAPLLETPVPPAPDAAELNARRTYLSGYHDIVNGQADAALARLDDARAQALRAGATGVRLDVDTLAAQVLYQRGRWDEATTLLIDARSVAERTGDRPRQAGVLLALGMGQFVRGRYDEALAYFEPVLRIPGIESDVRYIAALSNAGISHARLGEFDRALELQRRAVTLNEQRNVPALLEQALGELGHTEFLRGDPEAALALLSRARSVAAGSGRTANVALWLDSSSTVLVDLGRWDEAERVNEEAVALKQQGRVSLAPNLVNRAQIAAGRGDPARAAGIFQAALADDAAPPWVRWQAHAGLAAALQSTGRTREAIDHFEAALAVVENERAGLALPEHRMSFLSRMMAFHRAYVDALVTAGRTDRALEVADASRARVLAERSGVPPAARVAAATFVDRARRARSSMIFYWIAPARSFAWVVTPSGIHFAQLPASAEIDRLADRHRAFIERALGDPRRVSSAPGDALSAAVLAPVLPHVPADARVVVVPDGSLHGVNFETLPVGPDRRYWIEHATISVAPALSLARPARERTGGTPSVLVIGDPVGAGDGTLPRLKYAGAEIDGIRAAFPNAAVTVRRGAAASPAAFLSTAPERFTIVHFAAHATTNPLIPLESAIELSPEASGAFKLYARAIAERPLRADLVTISACRSAGDRAYGGEGLVGLAWAFLRAGATRVIAGLWDVDDQSTAMLMKGTYDGLAAGQSPADALRAAKLRLLASGGNFAKPYYWAPFQVFGN